MFYSTKKKTKNKNKNGKRTEYIIETSAQLKIFQINGADEIKQISAFHVELLRTRIYAMP